MAFPLKSLLAISTLAALTTMSAQSNPASRADSTYASMARQPSTAVPPPNSVAARKRSSATRLLNPASSGLNFTAAVTYPSGGNGGNSIAIADLNGDGAPDLVVASWCATGNSCASGSVGVLLGNGDGTFKPAVTYASGGLFADAVAIADLGNGKLDLIVGNCGSVFNNICIGPNGGVGVLLGNGDGTFKAAVSYSATFGVAAVAATDVNADSKVDLLIATNCGSSPPYNGCVGVLLGNGDGTFAAAVTYNSAGYSPTALAVGDVNGDSKPDLVITNCGTGTACGEGSVGVLLGNGDGTFATAVPYDSGGIYPDGVAIADVSGDGKADVVVANSSTSNTNNAGDVGVLLGNGDGTLQAFVAYPSGGFGASSIAVSDVNLDGKPDLVVANCSSTAGNCTGNSLTVGVGVLLGNGDGTFQTAATYASGGNTPFGIAVADLNGDGEPDIATANCVSDICAVGAGTVGVLINSSVIAPNFSLAATPATVTISAPGEPGTATIAIMTYGGLSASSVAFSPSSCSGLPALSSCAFGTLNSSNQITVTISTTASSDLLWPALGHPQRLFYAILLPGFLGVVTLAGRRRKSRILQLLALIAVFSLTTVWVACGSSSSSTPPPKQGTPTGTSTVTVNASSGTLQAKTTFTLTVN